MTVDRFSERFVGRAHFKALSGAQQIEIGGIALELAIAWTGQNAYPFDPENHEADYGRPFHAADGFLVSALHDAVNSAIPDTIAADPLPVPCFLGPVCRRCGCSEQDACFPSCGWAKHDLCTSCAEASKDEQERCEGFDPERPIRLCIGDRFSVQVADFAEASRRYLELQSASDEGCSTWPQGQLYAGTQEIGRVSYNGKVWAPVEWSKGDRPIYDPAQNCVAHDKVNTIDDRRAAIIRNYLETIDNRLMAGTFCRDTHEGCEKALHDVYRIACGEKVAP